MPLAVVLLLVFAPALAPAALIEVAWKLPGDALLTRDTQSELDWLDVTQTQLGVDGTRAELLLADEGAYPGFRWASADELDALFRSNGALPAPGGVVLEAPDAIVRAREILTLLGVPADEGMLANTCATPTGCHVGELGEIVGGWSHLVSDELLLVRNDVTAYPTQLLVRVVPEPTSALLLAGGLLGLHLWRRRSS